MKASFKFILAALAATAALAACTKEITPPNFENDKIGPTSEGSRVIAVSFAARTKTYLADDGLTPKFSRNDSILISNGTALDTCAVEGSGDNATISTDLDGPLKAVYPYKAARMDEQNPKAIAGVLVFTEQDGTFASANICMAEMQSENEESLSFGNETALFCITPGAGDDTRYVEVSAEGLDIANDVPAGATHTSFETIHVATTTADSVWVSILVPDGLTVGDLTFSDGTNEKTVTGDKASTAIAAGTLYTVTNENWKSPAADTPEPLKGVFTVADPDGVANSGDEIKVHFSQGNLQATYNSSTSIYTWGFAANQYDYIGNAAGNTTIDSPTNGAVVDLFGWSTDAVSNNWGIHTKASSADGCIAGNFKDWGEAIGDGNTWRTLSKEEWQYLVHTRTVNNDTGEGKSYQRATINSDAAGVYGMILYPDNYTGTAKTSYSSTEWTSLEEAGCVFLPAAGSRHGSGVTEVGDNISGNYWSSTPYFGQYALYVKFNSNGVSSFDDNTGRYYGHSVRLVTNVSAAPTPTPADGTRGTLNGHEYVVVAGVKWATQNLAITDSGNKKWKGSNTSAVKTPKTNEDVVVGDYFQWAASYDGYGITDNPQPDSLLVYESFTNMFCVDGGATDFQTSVFTFRTGKGFSKNCAPYVNGNSYSKYISNGDQLELTDDTANILWGETWRMPTVEDINSLYAATYWAYDSKDKGFYVFSPDANHMGGNYSTSLSELNKADALLFFPNAGVGKQGYSTVYDLGSRARYWYNSTYSYYANYLARIMHIYSASTLQIADASEDRFNGCSIRPVSD